MTSPSLLHTQARVQPRNTQPYLHTVFAWTKHNNLILNPDNTTCTLFPPDPADYKSNLDLKINNTALPMAGHPTVFGLTLNSKLIYAKKYIQPYIHTVFVWTKQNKQFHTKYRQSTCTLFTPEPAKYKSNLDIKINNTALPMATHPKVLGLTVDPKLAYSTCTHNIPVHTHTNLYK